MPSQTPIYGFPIYSPAGIDSDETGLTYFNDLTGDTSDSLTNRLEAILSFLETSKSTIYAKTASQWDADKTTILKAGEWGVDTTRGVLKLGNDVDIWEELSDYLPAHPVLSGSSAPTIATIGSLGQLYIRNAETPRLYICVKADTPYLWVSLSYADELENFRLTYDQDGSGIVDNAEKLGGQLPNYYLNSTQKGIAGGIATLDSNMKVPSSQLDFTTLNSAISDVETKANDAQNSADEANSAADNALSAAVVAQEAAQTAHVAANNKITGGYEINIPPAAWEQIGNEWVATIIDPKIPAETDEYRISPHINWSEATLANFISISGWMSVETPPNGGLYTITIGYTAEEAPDKPEFEMIGDIEILEVRRI